MSFRKILLSGASLGLLVSCDPRVFDDLADSTWVHTGGKPGGLSSAGYGSGLIGGSDGSGNLHYFVAAEQPAAVVLTTFDKSGNRTAQEVVLEGRDQLPVPTIMASDTNAFAATKGNVAVGVIAGGTPALAMLRADNKEATGDFVLIGNAAPTGITFGATDASANTDLLAVAGQTLNLIRDYQTNATVVNCALPATGGALFSAEVDDSASGAEILAAFSGSVSVGSVSGIMVGAVSDVVGPDCGNFTTTIPAPGGEASFGSAMVSGDFDGDGQLDLVISAPEENTVYLFTNWSVGSPSTGEKITAPSGSNAFGVNLAVGNFDGDAKDELVISDHSRDVDGTGNAGTVYIYSEGTGGAPLELHDASPETDQVFGKSLTVAKAFGGDMLIVGAKNEVFTYFRTPVEGDIDSRD